MEIPSMGTTLDMYFRDNSGNPSAFLLNFYEPDQFWDEMTDELKANGIKMEMKTAHVEMIGYPAGTIAHFQCVNLIDANTGPLRPVFRSY